MTIAAGFVERDGHHLLRRPGPGHARRAGPRLPQAPPGLLGALAVPARPHSPGRGDALGTGRLRDLRRHDLPQGLARLSRPDRPGDRSRPRGPTSPIGRPGGSTGCSATSVRSRARSRAGSRRTWASRWSSPTSAARRGPIIPFLARLADRFAGQSSVCDGRHGPPARAGVDEEVVLSSVTVHPQRGLKSWHTMSPSAPAESFSGSAQG